jgi:hypothetical protein
MTDSQFAELMAALKAIHDLIRDMGIVDHLDDDQDQPQSTYLDGTPIKR